MYLINTKKYTGALWYTERYTEVSTSSPSLHINIMHNQGNE